MRVVHFVFSLFFCFPCFAEIIEINDFKKVDERFIALQDQYNPAKVLGVFALQNTILRPTDPRIYAIKDYPSILKKSFSRIKPVYAPFVNEVLLTNYNYELVDNDLPLIINNIRSGGSPVIILANTISGNFNNIDRFEVWLANFISKFTIQLTESIDGFSDNYLDKSLGSYFYKGILCVGEHSRSNNQQIAIANFLSKTKAKINVIVAVDSELSTLKGLEEQIKIYANGGILFIGYHYVKNQEPVEDVDINSLAKFWQDFVDKINRIKRISKNSDNPYE